MELIYSVRRKPPRFEPPQLESSSEPEIPGPLVTVSSGNIIAFTSYTELTDCDGDSWGRHVYVCDLATPWDSHLVTSSVNAISALEWDLEGKQLLVGTTAGELSVYGMKEYLLNEWVCLYSASFPGEHIMKAIFFHNGRRVLPTDKKPDAPITDRFQQVASTPTLRGFGGSCTEGACVVTGTGLVCAVLQANSAVSTLSQVLRGTRDRLAAVAMDNKNSNVLVCTVSRGDRSVRSVLVSVRHAALHVQPLPSLQLPVYTRTPSLAWCLREDSDCLLVGTQTLSLWKLTERAHPIHKFLAKGSVQSSSTPGSVHKNGGQECYNTVVWVEYASWHEGGLVRAARGAGGAVCAALARRSTIQLLPDKLVPMCTVHLAHAGQDALSEGVPPPKKHKYGGTPPIKSGTEVVVSDMDISHLGGVLVVLDTQSQLYVYKLPQPWTDIPTPLSVQQAASVLEFAIVSGLDYLDVLMTVKSAALDAIYDRITESFQRQPQSFQQYYYQSWLTLRAAICRLSPSGQSSASGLTSLQSLHATCSTLEAALRPADSCPADVLAALLDDHHAALDIDKALLSVDVKEFSVEAGALFSLRRLVQRCCDTALSVIAHVPHLQQTGAGHHYHNYELCTDQVALNLLRKSILLIRIWGLVRPQALPSFARGADNMDAIYRPLTSLAALKTGAPIPQDIVEECASLGSQTCALRVWESLPRCSVPTPHCVQYPIQLEYGVEPERVRFSPEPPTYMDAPADAPAVAPMDHIRYMYLGGAGGGARTCGRCGTRGLPAAITARHPAQRAYDGRFLPTCRCGGKWTLVKNV